MSTQGERSEPWGIKPNNNNMKQITKLSAIILLAVIATACDPGYNEDMIIRNASSHTVTVIPGTRDCATGDSNYAVVNKSHTIAPNEEVVIIAGGGIGAASYDLGVCSFMDYYCDSVTFRFNGETGPHIVYHRSDTMGICPYNFNSKNYQYEEEVNNGLIFHGHRSYGKLTFTITDEHYDAAMNDDETMKR